ncbi:ABC transporter ATP-binding protein [Oceanidesulfovibrio marinus]|uniref:ABC transporter ATP-binding protein n=1 Tax=Oceanidesulfovibrio marinus TaxID=370038 RepID=A0ABX6NL48_9BACT|nr:ABC transporter ATP-binding protein [Oceanidesulfovibrio marinus]QJT11332.1 ABC transporter ATP-binding protein [Oceanidesulfovibrio marinus]
MAFLEIRNLVKRFGAFVATNDVSCDIDETGILSIIGPNGAGKTTFFNLLTGLLKPDSGSIHYRGKDITGLKPYQVVGQGIARSFQVVSLFEEMTVLENVCIGVQHRLGQMRHPFRSFKKNKQVQEKAMEILERVNIADKANNGAAYIPHGDRKILDLAVAITSEPQTLLLDEPMAGLSKAERLRITDLIKELNKTTKIIIVEHDMDLVFGISDEIIVLHHGTILATGTPKEIANNNEVQAAYLGHEVQ